MASTDNTIHFQLTGRRIYPKNSAMKASILLTSKIRIETTTPTTAYIVTGVEHSKELFTGTKTKKKLYIIYIKGDGLGKFYEKSHSVYCCMAVFE